MRIGLLASLVALVAGAGAAAEAAPFPSAWLPRHGDGYQVPGHWAERGLRYGTPELVGLVERAARAVLEELPGSTLYVADLSLKSGAWTQWHRSHRNGCDADLIYYAVDDEGRPAPAPSAMVQYDEDGLARAGGGTLIFDTPRNWALVKALIEDPDAQVVRIFVAAWLRERLLAYAHDSGEGPAVIQHAAAILEQPSDSQAHDDHMHVRVAPPAGLALPDAEAYARADTRTVVEEARGRAAHRPKAKLARHQKGKMAHGKKKVVHKKRGQG